PHRTASAPQKPIPDRAPTAQATSHRRQYDAAPAAARARRRQVQTNAPAAAARAPDQSPAAPQPSVRLAAPPRSPHAPAAQYAPPRREGSADTAPPAGPGTTVPSH